MKRTNPETPAYLSVCMIVRDCEKSLPGSLEACLKSVREIAPDAEICIVDTMSSDATPEIAQRYADRFETYAGPKGTWNKDTKFDALKPGEEAWDAAASRNRSFELATGRWKLWIDSDDILLWEESARKLLLLNGRWHPIDNPTIPEGAEEKAQPLIDTLRWIERKMPHIKVLNAPYLYRSDENGAAQEWQDRERIIRSDAPYTWKSKGHEICVPIEPKDFSTPGYLPRLLYWHRKQFSMADLSFSVSRHWGTLIVGYENGTDRSTRTCLYLANFAHQMAPERVQEFLAQAYEAATIPLDRYRTLIDMAKEKMEASRIQDAYELIHSAIGIRGDLPDAYIAGAEFAKSVEDWGRAAEWFEQGARCKPGLYDSSPSMTPRAIKLSGLLAAAISYWHIGRLALKRGDYALGENALARAASLAKEVYRDEMTGPDGMEARAYAGFLKNERDAVKHLLSLRDLHDYLIRNDETAKAARVIDVIPHQHAHGAIAESIRRWSKKIEDHAGKAYADFYNDDPTTGAIPSTEESIRKPIEAQQWRIAYTAVRIAKYLAETEGPITILDYGCFDGLSSIPLILTIPPERLGKYIAYDIQQSTLKLFKERVETLPELAPYRGKVAFELGSETGLRRFESLDMVVCLEVVEHVVDPVEFTASLLNVLKPTGELVYSTPWGAYDKGIPPDKNAYGQARDERGHLRAITPRDLWEIVVAARGQATDMDGQVIPGGYGASFCLAASPRRVYRASMRPKPVSFYVAAALWDWNASHVYRTGIGASEETIVFLARALAANALRDVAVFGPVPVDDVSVREEVKDRVAYWDNSNLHLAPAGKLVISRVPSLGAKLGGVSPGTDKILWLQDAIYPDLNPAVAAAFERIVVVSDWHKTAMYERHGVPLDKMGVAYNFLLKEHFVLPEGKQPKRIKHRLIWPSSPDRGLLTILRMWPAIRAMWPDATLGVYYGWAGCQKLASQNAQWAASFRAMYKEWLVLKKQEGILDYGRVNHAQIAFEMLKSDVWFYPSTGPGATFEETGCSNASKARAAGCVPVFHPIAALTETARCREALEIDEWNTDESFEGYTRRCLGAMALAASTSEAGRAVMMREAVEKFSLEAVLPLWEGWLR